MTTITTSFTGIQVPGSPIAVAVDAEIIEADASLWTAIKREMQKISDMFHEMGVKQIWRANTKLVNIAVTRTRRVNYDLLKENFPEAYAACVDIVIGERVNVK